MTAGGLQSPQTMEIGNAFLDFITELDGWVLI